MIFSNPVGETVFSSMDTRHYWYIRLRTQKGRCSRPTLLCM